MRCRINRLTHLDRATGEPIRRYEHDKPGDLLHVDVKELGKAPGGGGWRYVGRRQGQKNRAATPARTVMPESRWRQQLVGTCYLHTVIDDHSRVAYVEAHDDETEQAAAAVLAYPDQREDRAFHRPLAEGWAFEEFYNSESARLAALPPWVHEYNHHRPHSAMGKAAPIARSENLAGHHS